MRAVNRAESWWGWHWTPPVPMSIVEIVRSGSMPLRLAAVFWVAMERGASLIVAAEPPAAGKTTTLTALLSFTPPETVAYFTCGNGETFNLPPLSDSHPTYILVNEMSDHLPVYTWGPHARRTFQHLAQGYSLATTMHTGSASEVVDVLERDLEVPREQIGKLTFIVHLHIGLQPSMVRRVDEVAFLRPHKRYGFTIHTLARWNQEDDSFSLFPSTADQRQFARWAGLSQAALTTELKRREGLLSDLVASGQTAIPAVNQAIEEYYRDVIAPSREAGR